MLQRMLERVLSARTPFELVVATTEAPADDCIAALCAELAVSCFRGHPTDLLDRHYRAALAEAADVVVKIPSDCPLIDPAAIDRVLEAYGRLHGRVDFVSNLHPPSWPDGNDVEVLPFTVLEAAFREAQRPYEREHTTPFAWDRPERFKLANVVWESGLDLSASHRLCVDYPEDYALVCAVFEELHAARGPVFGVEDIVALLARRPDIARLNAHLRGVNWYRHHAHELSTIGPSLVPR
jgi:spore coat polysaccharide biosynthesis protein SpsF